MTEWSELAQAVSDTLKHARNAATAPELVARIGFSGETPLAWLMRRDTDLLKAEAEERAAQTGATWVEKLEITCSPPTTIRASATDPLHEIRALIDTEILNSSAYESALAQLADTLQGQLPSDLRDLFGVDESTTSARRMELARQGSDDVLARLQPTSGSGSEPA